MSDLISFERMTGSKDELKALQEVLASVPSFSVKTTGEEPTAKMAKEIYDRQLPEGVPAENRFLFGVYFNHKMIGCLDMIKSYPDDKTVTLSLLLISDDVQGAGLGSEAFKEAETMVKEWKDFTRLRCEMVRTLDQVMPFWRKMGFRKTNESIPYEVGSVKSRCVVLEKNLFSRPGQQSSNNQPSRPGTNKKSKFQRNNKNFSQRRNNNDQERSAPSSDSTDELNSAPVAEVVDQSSDSES